MSEKNQGRGFPHTAQTQVCASVCFSRRGSCCTWRRNLPTGELAVRSSISRSELTCHPPPPPRLRSVHCESTPRGCILLALTQSRSMALAQTLNRSPASQLPCADADSGIPLLWHGLLIPVRTIEMEGGSAKEKQTQESHCLDTGSSSPLPQIKGRDQRHRPKAPPCPRPRLKAQT